ncbi:hypothetical protein CF326_g8990 [Tilletia indica]|nr:hypothetical protein CF326_g8990 [Tilletia indica]
MDVEAAFLNSIIDVELYMQPPDGLKLPRGCDTLRIRRGLYGFKQSARLWWKEAHDKIVSLGFIQLATEWCIYYLPTERGPVYLLLYVDDMLVAGQDINEVEKVKTALKEEWRMTDLGPASWVLGISMQRHEQGISLSQSAYIKSIVKKFGQENGRKALTPLPADLPTREGEPFPDRRRYQALIGSLLWVAIATRPDIAFSVGYLGRHSADPTYEHWEAGLRVVRNLDDTHTVGLWYPRNTSAPHLEGWVDADHAGDKDTRKSTTGYAFKVFGCLVSWGARRQDIVATSTVHAEYVAMAEAARENAYLRTLLNDFRQPCPHPTPLHGDNEGTLTLAKKPAFHQRTKHIEIRWHYIREAQEQGDVSVQSIRSAYHQADILTKSLPGPTHERLRRALGLLRVDELDEGEQGISDKRDEARTRRDATHPSNTHAHTRPKSPIPLRTGPSHVSSARSQPGGAARGTGTGNETAVRGSKPQQQRGRGGRGGTVGGRG